MQHAVTGVAGVTGATRGSAHVGSCHSRRTSNHKLLREGVHHGVNRSCSDVGSLADCHVDCALSGTACSDVGLLADCHVDGAL